MMKYIMIPPVLRTFMFITRVCPVHIVSIDKYNGINYVAYFLCHFLYFFVTLYEVYMCVEKKLASVNFYVLLSLSYYLKIQYKNVILPKVLLVIRGNIM